jgi:hypothetical protein
MRLQLADGPFDGKRLIDQKALSETHSRQMLTGFSPLTGLPGFYGLGRNVNYDAEGRLRLGIRGLRVGAATNVQRVPSEHLGRRRPNQRLPDRLCRSAGIYVYRRCVIRQSNAGLGGAFQKGANIMAVIYSPIKRKVKTPPEWSYLYDRRDGSVGRKPERTRRRDIHPGTTAVQNKC